MIPNSHKTSLRIIGHRGAPSLAPENTLESFCLASDMGLKEVEFDLRLSRDGVPMIIHDASLKRTHNITSRVAHTTAKNLVLHGVPTLDDVLDLLHEKKLHATVEIKSCSIGALPQIVRQIKSLNLTLSSFDINWPIQASQLDSDLSLQWTVEKLTEFHPMVTPQIVLRGRMCEIAADIRYLTQEGVDRAKAMGLSVLAYTVKTQSQLEKAQRLGVDGIFVDNAPQIMEWLRVKP